VTAYFSRNFTDEDHEVLDKFLAHVKINILNIRSFKKPDNSIIVSVASVDKKTETHEFEGRKFIVEWGEFSFLLDQVNESLSKALPHVANQN